MEKIGFASTPLMTIEELIARVHAAISRFEDPVYRQKCSAVVVPGRLHTVGKIVIRS